MHHGQKLAGLHQQQNAHNGQHHRAQSAVEHIVGAGGEAAELLPQQGGGRTGGLDRLFPVLRLGGGAGGGGDADKRAAEHQICQRAQRQRYGHHKGDGQPVALAHASQQIQGIGRAPDGVAHRRQVGQQLIQQVGRPEADHVVQAKEHQRDEHRQEVLALELGGDLSHHPAQHAGEHQHEQGHRQHQHHAARDGGRGGVGGAPVEDHGGQQHHAGEHQPHEIHAQQPGCQYRPDGDGHAQQQVVVLGLI